MLRDWTDSYRFDCISPEAEVLFTRLIMKADDYGNFHGDSRIVASMCFPLGSRIVVEDALDELANRGLIMFYKVEGREYLNIPNFGQRMRNGMSRKFPAHAGESPESAADCGKARPERNKKGIEDEENRKAFEKFWAAYPRKVGRGLAENAWANADLPDIEVILAAIRKARNSADWQKEKGAFIPHPTTWLNQRRWMDEGMDYAALAGKRVPDPSAAREKAIQINEQDAYAWASERYDVRDDVKFADWPEPIQKEYLAHIKNETQA
jgi:hypothetical protein